MSYVEEDEYERDTDDIEDRITRDGRDGWRVEPGRYRLVVARACPWANRAIIVRRLLGLERVLSMGVCGPVHDERSWSFHLDPDGRDPVLGIERLREAYLNRFPDYPKGITVPALVEVETVRVVTNDYPQLTLDLSTEWTEHHRHGAPDLYPEDHRDEIDEVMAEVYEDVNNGVYRCGFAGSQEGYERAYRRLFEALDRLSGRLERAFPQIKRHYYEVHRDLNPTGIVPLGPDPSGWLAPHRREELGGRPFGDGTAPPPPPPDETVPPGHSARAA